MRFPYSEIKISMWSIMNKKCHLEILIFQDTKNRPFTFNDQSNATCTKILFDVFSKIKIDMSTERESQLKGRGVTTTFLDKPIP